MINNPIVNSGTITEESLSGSGSFTVRPGRVLNKDMFLLINAVGFRSTVSSGTTTDMLVEYSPSSGQLYVEDSIRKIYAKYITVFYID